MQFLYLLLYIVITEIHLMDNILNLGKQVLAAQPFSHLIGAELTSFRSGYAEISITIQPRLFQQHGSVHGGVLSYAADNALTFAGGSILGPNVVTAAYTINYLKAAQSGSLIARAIVISNTTRQAVCRCDIWNTTDQGEVLCAVAQGTIITLSPSS